MERFETLTMVLDYIENNLTERLTQENCAKAAICSLSGLQKLFRYVFHYSVGEYIVKRRMSCAAKELKDGSSVLDTALKYGYGSSEAFSRAFSRVWGITPAMYRKSVKFAGICPKLDFPRKAMYKGEIIMTNKFDISELYDYIREKTGTYVICFDISRLMDVNETFGREAGDAVILEGFRRIDNEADESMLLFRIGGDEFALVTGYSDKEEVCRLADRILSRNGEKINAAGNDLAVSMRAGAVLLNKECRRYDSLFKELMSAPSLDPEHFSIR